MACNTCNRIKHVSSSNYVKEQHNTPVNYQTPVPSISPTVSVSTPSKTTCSNHKIKSLDEVLIQPIESPNLTTIRSQEFTDTLVSIPDANIVKNLCKPEEVEQITCPDCSNQPVYPTCLNPKAEMTQDTEGHELPYHWLDAKPVTKMTILGRVGRYLSKLVGEGVLWLDKDGLVSVKKFLPFRTSHLWHKWYKPTPTSAPVIGNPMNYPYKVITDLDGNPYTIMGLPNEDSIEKWNAAIGEYEQVPASELLQDILASLGGEGMLCFRKIEATDCDNEQFEPVFIENPSVESVLIFDPTSSTSCPEWRDVHSYEGIRGEKGDSVTGPQGPQGPQGVKGADGVVTTYNDCCNG